MNSSGSVKQIIRFIFAGNGTYTHTGINIDPDKSIVIINGGTSDTNDWWIGAPYLVELTSTQCTVCSPSLQGFTPQCSVQIVEFY